jgi:hypothetical protein
MHTPIKMHGARERIRQAGRQAGRQASRQADRRGRRGGRRHAGRWKCGRMANKSHSLCRRICFAEGCDNVAALVAERNTPSKLCGGMKQDTGRRPSRQAGRETGEQWVGGQTTRNTYTWKDRQHIAGCV